jgi:hypothetical protein
MGLLEHIREKELQPIQPLTIEYLNKVANELNKTYYQEPVFYIGIKYADYLDLTQDAITHTIKLWIEDIGEKRFGKYPYRTLYLSLFEKSGLYKVIYRPYMRQYRYVVYKGTQYLFDTNTLAHVLKLKDD